MRGFIFRLFTFFFILFFLLCFLEIGLRIFWNGKPRLPKIPPNPRYYEVSDPEISYTLIPNHVYNKGIIKTNKYGFRVNTSIQDEKKPGIFRILLLGDSIVFGVRLREDKTIGEILRRLLAKYDLPGFSGFEVINLGMPGHNLNQYAAVLDRYGIRYSPDVIVAGITISNDLEGRQARYLGNGHLYLEPTASFTGVNDSQNLPPRFIRWTYIWRYFFFHYSEAKRQERKRDLISAAGVPPKIFLAPMNENDEVWKNVREGFRRLDVSAKKAGAEKIVLLFPAVEQVYYKDISDFPQKYIRKMLMDKGWSVFDFYNDLREAYRITGMLPFNDLVSHPSFKTNEMIAAYICDRIGEIFGGALKSDDNPVKLGYDGDISNLSFGWGQRRKTGNIRFRNVQGASARIVFRIKDSKRLSGLEITAAAAEGCNPQKVYLFINSRLIGDFEIKDRDDGFLKYKIAADESFEVKDYNTLDLKVKNACIHPAGRLLARYERLDSVSISEIAFK